MSPEAHRQSVQEIYETHAAFVWRALLRLGVPESDVPDAMQDTFLIVHRKLDAFENRCAMSTWLFSICRSVAKDRRNRAHVMRELLDHDRLLSTADAAPNAFDRVELRQRLLLVQDLLDDVPADQREAFLLHEVDGLTGEQIAKQTGCSPNTAHSRVRLARNAFYPRYERRMADPPCLTNEHKAHVWAILAPLLLKDTSKAATAAGATTTLPALTAYLLPATVALLAGAVGIAAAVRSPEDGAFTTPAVVRTEASATAMSQTVPSNEAPFETPQQPAIASAAAPAVLPASAVSPRAATSSDVGPTRRGGSALAAETAMVRDARESLKRDDPSAAIARLREAKRRFPEGAMAEEREFLMIEAMARLKAPGTQERKQRFNHEHPDSPFTGLATGRSAPASDR